MKAPIIKRLVKAVAEDSGFSANGIMQALLPHQEKNLPIPKELITAATEDNRSYSYIIIELLFSIPRGGPTNL